MALSGDDKERGIGGAIVGVVAGALYYSGYQFGGAIVFSVGMLYLIGSTIERQIFRIDQKLDELRLDIKDVSDRF